MRAVIETPTFEKQVAKIWSESERLDFINYISENPLAGDVIPNAQGARKIRWQTKRSGKRGGARVIYFNLDAQGVVYLIAVYTKSEKENISPDEIKRSL